jgi:hypothetical protein
VRTYQVEKEPPRGEGRPTFSDCRRRLAVVELRAAYGSNARDCGHSAEDRQMALSATSGQGQSFPKPDSRAYNFIPRTPAGQSIGRDTADGTNSVYVLLADCCIVLGRTRVRMRTPDQQRRAASSVFALCKNSIRLGTWPWCGRVRCVTPPCVHGRSVYRPVGSHFRVRPSRVHVGHDNWSQSMALQAASGLTST